MCVRVVRFCDRAGGSCCGSQPGLSRVSAGSRRPSRRSARGQASRVPLQGGRNGVRHHAIRHWRELTSDPTPPYVALLPLNRYRRSCRSRSVRREQTIQRRFGQVIARRGAPRVPIRAAVAGAPGGSGWIPALSTGRHGPAAFLLVLSPVDSADPPCGTAPKVIRLDHGPRNPARPLSQHRHHGPH